MPSTAESPETAAPQPTLSFAGSEVLGSNLVPSLAEAFLKHEGALDVRRIDDPSRRQIVVEGVFGAEATVRNIRISAHGSHTAFETLAEGRADIGMAAREITYEEHLRLRLLANMAESLKEAPLALDGIAIIVNPAESVDTIPYAQYTADALRLSFGVRFSAASATLDDTARHTIQRAVDF